MDRIHVRFTCGQCHCKDVLVSVDSRDRDMDVRIWMTQICIRAIADRHRLLSPKCQAKVLQDIKIPMTDNKEDEDNWVGKMTEIIPPVSR